MSAYNLNLLKVLLAYVISFKGKSTIDDIGIMATLYCSRIGDPMVLPAAPPEGWIEFNKKIGGLPWHGSLAKSK